MERRQLLKFIGFAALAGSAGVIAACNNIATADEKTMTNDSVSKPIEPELTEREKLIVNRTKMSIQDKEKPTELELKHTPEISFGEPDEKGFVKTTITLGSGGIIHPADENHWIDYLKIFVNDKEFAHVENKNGGVRGFSDFWIKLEKGAIVKAEAGCNLHGIWENIKTY